MKKLLSIILVLITLAIPAAAQENKGNAGSRTVGLHFHQKNSCTPTVKRAPMHIAIEAYYNADSNAVEISYAGEAEGEVFIYLDEELVGYDSALNTSILLPVLTGTFHIEIVGETWEAQGDLLL